MNELNNFNVPLDHNETRKIQEERKPYSPEELAKIQKNLEPRRFETTEFFSAYIKATCGAKMKEENELSKETRKKISELIDDIKKQEEEKEKKDQIPLKFISISATDKGVIFIFDYFDEIVIKKYSFNSKKWKVSKLPKPEFNQPAQ